jgi:hypothetical protein
MVLPMDTILARRCREGAIHPISLKSAGIDPRSGVPFASCMLSETNGSK